MDRRPQRAQRQSPLPSSDRGSVAKPSTQKIRAALSVDSRMYGAWHFGSGWVRISKEGISGIIRWQATDGLCAPYFDDGPLLAQVWSQA